MVGPERLADYSHRGNLPMRRAVDGTLLFDEQVVARFFRMRACAPLGAAPCNLGVLGTTRLGVGVVDATTAATSFVGMDGGRESRRRQLRRSSAQDRVLPTPRVAAAR